MSIVKTSSVFCDDCGDWVGQYTEIHGGTPAARQEARDSGWVRRSGRDLCPSCDPKHVHDFEHGAHQGKCWCGIWSSGLANQSGD